MRCRIGVDQSRTGLQHRMRVVANAQKLRIGYEKSYEAGDASSAYDQKDYAIPFPGFREVPARYEGRTITDL